jgi:hypothetical protein
LVEVLSENGVLKLRVEGLRRTCANIKTEEAGEEV